MTLEGDYPAMTVYNGGHRLAETVTLETITACMNNIRRGVESAPRGVRLGQRQWDRLRQQVPSLPEEPADSGDVSARFGAAQVGADGGLAFLGFPVYVVPVPDFFEWIY
jgi:hypothetical protein